MTGLAVDGLVKRFGAVTALDGASLKVQHGELLTVVGPTNAGKSTLLKTVAGLNKPDAGSVSIDGRDVTNLEPRERRVSLLFQNVALFPNLTGFENIAFPLRAAREDSGRIAERVLDIARDLQVSHLLDREPRTYSGGEQQRVAIGRALAHPSRVLMLDEPLTNLDARIRIALRIRFKSLHRAGGRTILYVTHDQVEAMSLSDRIAVLNDGRFEQVGTPDEIYRRPATRFVATFLGSPPMNILELEVEDTPDGRQLRGPGTSVTLQPDAPAPRERRLGLGVRPEEFEVAPEAGPATPFAGEVSWVEHLGDRAVLDCRLADQPVKAVVPPDHPVTQPGRAFFGFSARAERLLDLDTGRFLRPPSAG